MALTPRAANRVRLAAVLGVLGPGLVSGFADNDAGGITTYSLAGAQFGYDLLWVLLASQIVLFFTQEVGARLGLATGQGLTGLARERFGVRWAAFLTLTMLVANLGSTVAEFAGTSAALGLFGVPTPVSAVLAAGVVILLLTRGSFSRVQYLFVAVGIGVSLAYLASALIARPDWGRAAFVPGRARTARSRRPTGWRSWARSAPPSRRGARRSSSRTWRTSGWARRTWSRSGSTWGWARCSPT